MTHTGAFNYKAKKTTTQLLSCGVAILLLFSVTGSNLENPNGHL